MVDSAKQGEQNDPVQQAGKALLIYVYSMMKTGEIHDLNNDAWLRPAEKLINALEILIKVERQSVTLVVAEGIAQVNSHALWLDSGAAEQAEELEKWLARREAGGIIFSEVPSVDHARQFFFMFARFVTPEDADNQLRPLAEAMLVEGINTMKLAPQPLRLEGVGKGVRGVASLWYYAKGGAAMEEVLSRVPIETKAARRIAQELVDAAATEQDLLCALPLLSLDCSRARRAVDVAVFCIAVARGLGLSAINCAGVGTSALLQGAGAAYENPDATEFTLPELAGVLAVRQIEEGTRFSAELARRLSAAIESHVGVDGKGPPYLVSPARLGPESQLIALSHLYLDQLVEGASPLQVGLDLLTTPPKHLDAALVAVFVATIGLLPVGTVVELRNGDLGVVSDIDHLRGQNLYHASPAPVSKASKIYVERLRTARGKVVSERKARVQLGEMDERGQEWAVERTLKREGLEDLVVRALVRRPSTVVAQMGIK